ncbi:MAG: SDR family NAD(P)-dependent oxidoreductase [Acidobacteria bacterium]|nr:SDR family NAD(P)-dependent oxidoreductase [Acidobacteriota bacterium]MCL5288784.1 SDR family NAD(P)-dependent oxidoreductase [Acidobacteriota bacterium]
MDTQPLLAGQVALVTGASRGIGLAIARRLGKMGARLALCARGAERLHKSEIELRQAGCETLGVAADVTDAAAVDALVQEVIGKLGGIDILVNNAGVGVFAPLHELREDDWDRVMNTNLKGVFLCSRAVAPQMIRRRSGHIINISSLAGKNAFAKGGVYCASKWGLQGMTACMAEDLRGYGIRVSAVCPGTVETEFSPHAGKDAKKMLQPEDVAHVVAMLVTQAEQSFVSEVDIRPTQKP